MARIRTIKPEFWTDGIIVKLPYEARLLFIGLWNFADDDGCLWDEPDRIKMQIFPGDPVDVAGLLDLLVAAERLDRYQTADGERYLVIRHFRTHQKVDHPARSQFPTREDSRKLAIPQAVRRAVAKKYGCAAGGTIQATCYYCGQPGQIHWFQLSNGQPSAWVYFAGLELDHFHPESQGGEATEQNLVLACMECNRSKGAQSALDFLSNKAGVAKSREGSRGVAKSRPGMEGNGMEIDSSAGNADAPPPAVIPVRSVLKKKSTGLSLAPVVDAFRELGLPNPIFKRGEARAAQDLLDSGFRPAEIAQCWQDHATGVYGDDFSKRDLSFDYLANRQRIANWKRWVEQGRTSRAGPNNGRADRPGPDLPNVTGKKLPWEVAT